MKRTTISLTEDLATLLEQEAHRRRISVSALVRDLVRQSLAPDRHPRRLPFAALFEDPGMVTGDSVGDVLERSWAERGRMGPWDA